MDWITQEERMKALKTAAIAGGTSAAVLKLTGDNRSRIAQYPYNFLKGFYGGGQINQGLAVGREVAANALPIMRDLVDPRTSYAYKQTGMSTRGYNELLKLQDDISNRQETMGRQLNPDQTFKSSKHKTEFFKNKKALGVAQRQQFYKMINDYSNRYLYRDNPPATDDVARFAKQWVKPVTTERAMVNLGGNKEIMDWMVKGQPGIKDVNKVKFLEHKMGAKVGDVMRGAQFDRPVYKAFVQMNEIGLDKMDASSYKKAILNAGIKEENIKTFGDKVFFKVSPGIKPNYDWGGYQAIVEYDEARPGKVKFHATDKRDLFGMKLGGKNVLNIAPAKEIKIPEIIANIQDDLPVERKKQIVREHPLVKHRNKKNIKKLKTNWKSPGINVKDGKELDRIIAKHGKLLSGKILTKRLANPIWLMRHASMGIGGLSVAAILYLAAGGIYNYNKSKDRRYKDRETTQ
jgi:hypothetical protein